MGLCGEVGLGVAGITSGLAGIGSVVGGGTIAGLGLTVAAPAVVAVAAGVGIYHAVKWFKGSRGGPK